MPLSAGTRLGAYEVIAAIGAGGMGLVEGPTLDELIASVGVGLPFDRALPIARQIAAALETAHDQGIVPSRSEAGQRQGP